MRGLRFAVEPSGNGQRLLDYAVIDAVSDRRHENLNQRDRSTCLGRQILHGRGRGNGLAILLHAEKMETERFLGIVKSLFHGGAAGQTAGQVGELDGDAVRI